MITFIKAKLKKSEDQSNIDNYRATANITEYHINRHSKFHEDVVIFFM